MREGSLERSFPSWERIEVFSQEEVNKNLIKYGVFLKPFLIFRKCILFFSFPKMRNYLNLKMHKGYFKYFDYKAIIRPHGVNGTDMVDKVEYCLRYRWIFPHLRKRLFERRLHKFFEYKHAVLKEDVNTFKKYPHKKPLKILLSGASGLVGRAVMNFLTMAGHDIHVLVRRTPVEGSKEIGFDYERGLIEHQKLGGFDVVIHLGGEAISTRWSKKKKQKILETRQESTRSLVKALASQSEPPKRFIAASAIGFYGEHGDELVDEGTERIPGSFLSSVCKHWEQACYFLGSRGMAVSHLRFGMILSSRGGALKKMLPFFRAGVGGILGDGQQYTSWVTIDDVVNAIYHIVMKPELQGPFNIVSPNPVTNQEFSEKLAEYLKTGLGPRMPGFFLRFLFGDMADEVLLTSIRAVPTRLLESGYTFRYPTINESLKIVVK